MWMCYYPYMPRLIHMFHITQQNSYSMSHLLGTVTTQLLNCVVSMLPAAVNSDHTVIVQSLSLCSHICLAGD